LMRISSEPFTYIPSRFLSISREGRKRQVIRQLRRHGSPVRKKGALGDEHGEKKHSREKNEKDSLLIPDAGRDVT